MAVFIHMEKKKHSFSLVGTKKSVSDEDFIKWVPKSLPKGLYSRSGNGGQYQLIISS